MSEVRCLKNLVRTKSEVSIFCTLLNTKTIRLKFVLHVVLAYLMFGMIFQAMSIKLPKAGSTIPEDSISTTKNMSKNKKWGHNALYRYIFLTSYKVYYVYFRKTNWFLKVNRLPLSDIKRSQILSDNRLTNTFNSSRNWFKLSNSMFLVSSSGIFSASADKSRPLSFNEIRTRLSSLGSRDRLIRPEPYRVCRRLFI